MRPTFFVPERGVFARLGDALMYPIMKALGPRGESPQLTHKWNNIKVDRRETDHLEEYAMMPCEGDPRAKRRRGWWDIRFHFGAWPRYVVIAPVDWKGVWYIGWIGADEAGASQIPIKGPVRMLVGPDDVIFFGVREGDNEQIDVHQVGEGAYGGGGPFRHEPFH